MMWIQVISLFVTVALGWIDLLPESGPVSHWKHIVLPLLDVYSFCLSFQIISVPQFWHKTGQTFLCHFNIQYEVPATMNHQATLDYLSNLTPGSSIYNETVQKLRRSRRHINHKKYFHKRINSHTFNDQINETVLNRTTHLHSNSSEPDAVAPSAANQTNKQHTNVEKYLRKYKNHIKSKHKSAFNENQTPVKVSQLILNDSNIVMDCKHLMVYSFLFAGVYVVFGVCLIRFLFLTESAVFTVAVVSSSLPVSGIFWSLFELTTSDFVGEYLSSSVACKIIKNLDLYFISSF